MAPDIVSCILMVSIAYKGPKDASSIQRANSSIGHRSIAHNQSIVQQLGKKKYPDEATNFWSGIVATT